VRIWTPRVLRVATAASRAIGLSEPEASITALVGHSYGGAVITDAGTHDSVVGLVYIAAFAPDRGESASALLATLPPDGPVPPILPPKNGFLFLDQGKFAHSFAADVPASAAAFMAHSQVPWGVEALNGTTSEPAWHSRPSWYLNTTVAWLRSDLSWPHRRGRRRRRPVRNENAQDSVGSKRTHSPTRNQSHA
jgi:pimeloyl-ACP methyl ester carboxylesterase